MNFNSIRLLINNLLFLTLPEDYRKEFNIYINSINAARAKTTAITLIVLEAIMLSASLITKKQGMPHAPGIYYGVMYILMLAAMTAYLIVFIKLGKNISKNGTSILAASISFASFLLLWCGAVSLLDQLSYGQITVYIAAILAVGVCSFFKPDILLLMYFSVHMVFIIFMPYFQKSGGVLFGNYVNSTSLLIISWVISRSRYKWHIEHFMNMHIIQEKNDQLKRLSRELEEANLQLEGLSQTDGLTGIANRRMFDRTIKMEWDRCKRHFTYLSLIIIDIDFFKSFNDTYGHQAGDDCLRQVAGVLSACARRSSDTVARYGGEEFAVILPYMEKEDAISMAEEMRSRVEEMTVNHENLSIPDHVTISLGVSTIVPSDKSSIYELIESADNALYEAKRGNRNNIVVA